MYANDSKADKAVFTPTEEPSFPWLLELISVRNLHEWRNKSLLIVSWLGVVRSDAIFREETYPLKSFSFKNLLGNIATMQYLFPGVMG